MTNENEEEEIESDVADKLDGLNQMASDVNNALDHIKDEEQTEAEQEQNGAPAGKVADEAAQTEEELGEAEQKEEAEVGGADEVARELEAEDEDIEEDVQEADSAIAQSVKELERYWEELQSQTGQPEEQVLADGVEKFRGGVEQLHKDVGHLSSVVQANKQLLGFTKNIGKQIQEDESLTNGLKKIIGQDEKLAKKQHDPEAMQEAEAEAQKEGELEGEKNKVEGEAQTLERDEEEELNELGQVEQDTEKALEHAEEGLELLERIDQRDQQTMSPKLRNRVEKAINEAEQLMEKDAGMIEKLMSNTQSMMGQAKKVGQMIPTPSAPSRKTIFGLGKGALALVVIVLVFTLVAIGMITIPEAIGGSTF